MNGLHLDEHMVPRGDELESGENRFRLLLVFRRIFVDCCIAPMDHFRESKNFVHKLATTMETNVNSLDGKLLTYCELLVGARGFEPPTSRSRNLQPSSAPVTL